MKKIKLKSQPKRMVRIFIMLWVLIWGITAFISNPIGRTKAQSINCQEWQHLAMWNICISSENDIVIQATATEPNQTIKINKYFKNTYTVDWWDGTKWKLTSDVTHTYTDVWIHYIILSLTWWADRREFSAIKKQFIPVEGTSMTWIKIIYMPSLSEWFWNSATEPGDSYFYYFNHYWALTELPEWSFNTSNITNVGNDFFYSFNELWKLNTLPEWSFNLSNISWDVWDNFFYYFNYEWNLESLPDHSFDTSNITSVWSGFFYSFNLSWKITSLPEWSFNISKIESVWDNFFGYFNSYWKITSLPGWSFNTSNIRNVENNFFFTFNYRWKITSLPEWSFDTSNIISAGDNFFAWFNALWAIEYLPDSFKMNSIWAVSTDWYNWAFYSIEHTLNKNVYDLVSNITIPQDDMDTFSDNQPWRCGVHENWLVNPAENCEIITVTIYADEWLAIETITGYNWVTITRPENPTKEGYEFRGRHESGSNNEFVFGVTVTSNINIYAIWEVEKYNINFYYWTWDDKIVIRSEIVEYNGTITQPPLILNIPNSYMAFDNWYTDKELSQVFDTNTLIKWDLELYGWWKESDEWIDFNGNPFWRENKTICDPDDNDMCITIMDRNLWGAWTWSVWYYYQRWNNYWFNRNSYRSYITTEKAHRNDSYNNKWYYWTRFIRYVGSPYDYRENDKQYNWLWWWAEDTGENNLWYDLYNHKDRQWPCPSGYHVPSAWERLKLIEYYDKSFEDDTTNKQFYNDFMLPFGQRIYGDWQYDYRAGNQAWYRSSSPDWIRSKYLWISQNGAAILFSEWRRTFGQMVRCFENRYTITFETNGGNEIEKQIIIQNTTGKRPEDPEKSWSIFLWWYTDSEMSGNEFNFEETMIDWNKTMYAKRGYMYTITDRDGTILKTWVVVEWWNIEISEIPQREWYRFVGWDKELNNISQDTVITAQYEKIVVSHGWWWSSISKDYCPNWDYSDSYYDWICWEKNITQDSQIVQDNDTPVDGHNSAGEFEYDSLKANPNYSDEMNEAYQYAYHYGITTMESIKEADMGWSLTRIAMAKMLSQYAINVLWQIPDTSKNNKFKDVSDQMNSEYDNWVTLAYQLWIMWINMPNNKFRPNDLVSRAEFVTALSRLLYNTPEWTFEKTSKYYIPHMDKLVYEWIITNTNPNMKELRWYVMLMLMRAK